MAKTILIIGGILALFSLLVTWWFAYYNYSSSAVFMQTNPMITLWSNSNQLIYNVSPIYFGSSNGVPLNQTTLGKHLPVTRDLLKLTIILVFLGGILGIASGIIKRKSAGYGVMAGVVVLAAIGIFVFTLYNMGGGIWILFGSRNLFSTQESWGFGPGLFIALVAGFIMILGSKTKPKKK
jgi:hypothetical protein